MTKTIDDVSTASTPISQAEAIAFLRSPAAWPEAEPGAPALPVQVIETHGAIIFLRGETAYKIKRAVRLPYFDFSTLWQREVMLRRELALNQEGAPEIYQGITAVVRTVEGQLRFGGKGEKREWVLQMHRFDQSALLANVVQDLGISRELATQLGDAVAGSHEHAPPKTTGALRDEIIIRQVTGSLAASLDRNIAAAAATLESDLTQIAVETLGLRQQRLRNGFIRRCHGDLHLGNIVVLDGKPVLFDALEFDESFATTDTLYDLAFLLMDIERYSARDAANIVLSRYLWRTGSASDLDALACLPMFLGLRAAIRAMVTLARANVVPQEEAQLRARALETLQLGQRLVTRQAPRLIVVGGLSGTGKTTLAGRLSPLVGTSPGAVHLRTDLERKWLAGAGETERLPPGSYTPEAAAAVFARVIMRADRALAAGHSVVLDGVLAHQEERRQLELLAAAHRVPFDGIWLTAPEDIMKSRVTSRTGDASDATPAVVDKQLSFDLGQIDWIQLDTTQGAEAVLAQSRKLLRLTASPLT